MDDFEVIAQWRRTAAALTALTERYQALNYEIGTRETLKWMMAP